MIKFIINPHSNPAARIFHKKDVLIGAKTNSQADICIDEASQDILVKVTEDGNRFIIINLKNDPFIALNGRAFGKKTLKTNDVLKIGKTEIAIEVEFSSPLQNIPQSPQEASTKPDPKLTHDSIVDTKAELEEILEHALSAKKKEITQKDLVEIPEKIFRGTNDEHSHLDIEDLIRQVEQFEPIEPMIQSSFKEEGPLKEEAQLKEEAPLKKEETLLASELSAPAAFVDKHPSNSFKPEAQKEYDQQHLKLEPSQSNGPAAPKNIPEQPLSSNYWQRDAKIEANKDNAHGKRQSLKDYYLSEFDDENENWNSQKKGQRPVETSRIFINWRLWLSIIGIILIIAAVIGVIFYFNASDKSEEEELKAAQGVADVAIALTYAQTNHIKPQNQNWSDPDFLKNNLAAILASEFTPLASLDNQGRFNNTPYILRIYTSSDLSQFLVIAQPAPSLLQWLIPKTAIIVDSHAMEMRKTKDLKLLNRLLVNSNTLDGTNAVDISNLVKQGDIMPLQALVEKRNHHGFPPPKALALLRPGAENLIYNAPRYYHFGESLMKKAITMTGSPSNSHEVAMLQEEIASISKFPHIVLYSSNGLQAAIQGQKALSTFIPQNKLLIAYLQFNSKGKITSSHLLMDDGYGEVALASQPALPAIDTEPESMPLQQITPQTTEKHSDIIKESSGWSADGEIDRNNPVYLQLASLLTARQQALKPISDQIAGLLSDNNHGAAANFTERFAALANKYSALAQEQNAKLMRGISQINEEYSALPFSGFMAYLKLAGVDKLVQENLKKQQESGKQHLSNQEVEGLLLAIQESQDLDELDSIVNKSADLLNMAELPDAEKLIAYQSSLRAHVLLKLGQFLLSANSPLPSSTFNEKNRPVLARILKNAWILDQDEIEFYMHEFDMLVKQNAENLTGSEDAKDQEAKTASPAVKWGARIKSKNISNIPSAALNIIPDNPSYSTKFAGGKRTRLPQKGNKELGNFQR